MNLAQTLAVVARWPSSKPDDVCCGCDAVWLLELTAMLALGASGRTVVVSTTAVRVAAGEFGSVCWQNAVAVVARTTRLAIRIRNWCGPGRTKEVPGFSKRDTSRLMVSSRCRDSALRLRHKEVQ